MTPAKYRSLLDRDIKKAQMEGKPIIVRAIFPLESGMAHVPADTLLQLTSKTKGFTARTIPCDGCGLSVTFTRIEGHRVVLANQADTELARNRIDKWRNGKKQSKKC